MLVDFLKMPSDSRIWIYQADRFINEDSQKLLAEKLTLFLAEWESHGIPLRASWKLFHGLFLVIAVDENHYPASGCSIDKSVQFITKLEADLKTGLLGKTSVAVLEKEHVITYNLVELKKNILEGKIQSDSIIFNNLVPTLGELDLQWKLPAEKTWISRYFNK